PDLIPGLTDEEAFGLTYPEIDKILIDFENGIERNDESAQKVRKIIELTKWRRLKSVGIDDFSEL
ncbi:MAG: NAD(+) synthetase, partial [Fervidobacterium sp.]|nr:NAD(+) synthetase [Fervidobacterium sp.]